MGSSSSKTSTQTSSTYKSRGTIHLKKENRQQCKDHKECKSNKCVGIRDPNKPNVKKNVYVWGFNE